MKGGGSDGVNREIGDEEIVGVVIMVQGGKGEGVG